MIAGPRALRTAESLLMSACTEDGAGVSLASAAAAAGSATMLAFSGSGGSPLNTS